MLSGHYYCVQWRNLALSTLVIRDGEPAEYGQSACGVEDGRFGTTQAATRAALVALLVGQGVWLAGRRLKEVRRLRHGPEVVRSCRWRRWCLGGGIRTRRRSTSQAGAKEISQLLAGVCEGVAAGPFRQLVRGEHWGRRDRGGAVSQASGAGEPSKTVAVLQTWSLQLIGSGERGWGRRGPTALFSVVNEVAAGTVRAEANGVEGSAELSLVFGMAAEAAQLVDAMGKLALVAILAGTILLKGPTKLCFVAAGVDLVAAGATRACTLLQQTVPSF